MPVEACRPECPRATSRPSRLKGWSLSTQSAKLKPLRGNRSAFGFTLKNHMTLDIKPLLKAITRLEEGLSTYQSDITQTLICDGLIQRFVFTYEITHKTLKRYLEQASATRAEYDNMPFQDQIRSANEQGLLLGDWPKWRGYRDMRARTSHTYDEEIAVQVVAGIPAFLQEVRYFRDQLRQRLAV